MNNIYKRYSEFLTDRYGEKIYKLPVNLPVSCPNRSNGENGCTYCGGMGAGFENLSSVLSVRQQLLKNKDYIGKRYKAKKFIAYFQNFTNTFLPLDQFRFFMNVAVFDFIVEYWVSTRPDCIRKEYLDILKEIQYQYGIKMTIELGLQTANYHSLKKINRGHSLAEYIESMMLIHEYGFETCTHLILNLPWDDDLDVLESAKIVSACKSSRVKLHALYIEKGTSLAESYLNQEFIICSLEEYEERVISFLEALSPEIVVERLLGRAPEENTLFSNWGQSWWKIRDEIEEKMISRGSYQGKNSSYLGGSGVRLFFD